MKDLLQTSSGIQALLPSPEVGGGAGVVRGLIAAGIQGQQRLPTKQLRSINDTNRQTKCYEANCSGIKDPILSIRFYI